MKHQNFHRHQHHIKYLFKLIIFVLLVATAIIPLIYILGNQNFIAKNTIHQHPLFHYYDQYFTRSNITRQLIINKFYQVESYLTITERNKDKKLLKNDRKFWSQNVLNLIGVGNQSRDIDNLVQAFEYISFIANKQAKIIKKYLHSDSLKKLILNQKKQIEKSLQLSEQEDQENEESQQIQAKKDQNLQTSQNIQVEKDLQFKSNFTSSFLQFFYISQPLEQLAKKPILYNFKDYIDKHLQKFIKLIKSVDSSSSNQNKPKKQTRYWIVLYLNSQIGSQSAKMQGQLLLKQLKTLTKRYPSDRFLITSLNLIPQISEARQIFLPKTSEQIFESLLRSYLNVTDIQIRAVARHYDYSLLKLSKDVYNDDTFNLYDMVGGRLGYRNISSLKPKYQNIIQRLCIGNRSSLQRHSRQQERINFYRIGLYEFYSHYSWKNKYVKMNYEFQTGNLCPSIKADGLSYYNIGDSLLKRYSKTMRKFFRKNIQKFVDFLYIEEEVQEQNPKQVSKAEKQIIKEAYLKQKKKDSKNSNTQIKRQNKKKQKKSKKSDKSQSYNQNKLEKGQKLDQINNHQKGNRQYGQHKSGSTQNSNHKSTQPERHQQEL